MDYGGWFVLRNVFFLSWFLCGGGGSWVYDHWGRYTAGVFSLQLLDWVKSGWCFWWARGDFVAVVGMNVGNFNHVKHFIFHTTRGEDSVRVMNVGSLYPISCLTCVLGCSAVRNRFSKAVRTSIRGDGLVMGNGRVHMATRHGPTSLG